MCERYRLRCSEKMAQKFHADFTDELRPPYNIAPTQPVPVVHATDSGRVISSMRWGLIPSWAKDSLAFNERSIRYKHPHRPPAGRTHSLLQFWRNDFPDEQGRGTVK